MKSELATIPAEEGYGVQGELWVWFGDNSVEAEARCESKPELEGGSFCGRS